MPTSPKTPFARRSLYDEVVTRIRDTIIEGTLEPGARIHEALLALTLGIPRTPLGETLMFFASEELTDLEASRGVVVKSLSPKGIRDVPDVLSVLAALACRDASDAEIFGVCALHDRMVARYRMRDRLEYCKLKLQLHARILRIFGNGSARVTPAAEWLPCARRSIRTPAAADAWRS